MGFFDKLNPVKAAIDAVKELGSLFIQSPEERNKFNAGLAKIEADKSASFEETLRIELDAKSRILIAELSQDDNWTKRARPSVVYTGLLLVVLEVILQDLVSKNIPLRQWWSKVSELIAFYVRGPRRNRFRDYRLCRAIMKGLKPPPQAESEENLDPTSAG